jgi:dipeptidyl aminopeptidase/acylaminoacyl peptidase
MASTTDGVNSSLLYRDAGTGNFVNILTTNFREGISPLFFDFTNESVYALSNLGRDKVAIVRFDPQNGREIELLFEHPEVDVEHLSYSKKRKVITTTVFTTWKKEFKFFDAVAEKRFLRIRELVKEDAEIYITDRNKEEDRFIVRTLSDKSLGNYYLYDETSDRLMHLANVSPWLQPDALCDMQPITYTARDGLTIHGYLTLPKNNSGNRLPVIVNPHGGPWARDTWHFDPEVQFLASRGFAVLQMNFRGSTGYGKKFWELSFRQWGKTMQDDITDAVHYLIDQGIADKNKIGIYGASYGGYAVLAGLTLTPDLYACGVDYVGVSSLFTFMETIPPYWEPYLDMMYEMVGHPVNERELLASASPLNHIDNIRVPLFVAQGAMDPRVKKSESDQIVEALRKKGVEVQYMVKEQEGHGFSNEENRFEFYEAMEIFFEKHLMGKE